MNPFYIEQFHTNKEALREHYKTLVAGKSETEFEYSDIFEAVFTIAVPFAIKTEKWAMNSLSITDKYSVSGDIIALIASRGTPFYIISISYGSCDCNDVLDYINKYWEGDADEKRVLAMMAFSLHIVQRMQPLYLNGVIEPVNSYRATKDLMGEVMQPNKVYKAAIISVSDPSNVTIVGVFDHILDANDCCLKAAYHTAIECGINNPGSFIDSELGYLMATKEGHTDVPIPGHPLAYEGYFYIVGDQRFEVLQ